MLRNYGKNPNQNQQLKDKYLFYCWKGTYSKFMLLLKLVITINIHF